MFNDLQFNQTEISLVTSATFLTGIWRCETVELLQNNVALDGEATQVSTFNQGGVLQEASYAIDGNFSTDLNNGARCSVTGYVLGAWWQVDLQSQCQVVNISITTVKHSGVFKNKIVICPLFSN